MAKQAAATFRYKERPADTVKKRAEQDGGAFDSIFKSGIDIWRPKQGDNLIRFLPPTWDDPEHYGYDVWVHGYIGADNGSYLCPKKMLNERCPICEAQKEAADAGETEEAKDLKARKQVAAWIIDRDEDKPTPQVYLMSWTMDRDIAALCHNKRTGKVLQIDNPETGYDFTIKRSGQGLKTRYFGLAIDRDASPMMDTQKEINTIMEYVEENPIPDILAYKDAKYLAAVIEGTNAPKEEIEPERPRRRGAAAEPEEDVVEEPTSRRRRAEPPDDDPPPRRRAAAPEADSDDDPPPRRRAAAAEPPDDDPPPRRRRAEPEDEPADDPPPRRRAAAPDPDDDPPPRRRREPEPEPEDDPPPRRRAAAPDPDDDPPPRRRAMTADPEDDPPPRRRAAEPPEEVEEPPRRRRAEPPDDDPPPRRRAAAAEPEDDPPPRRRAAEPPDDDPPPRRRAR